MFKKPTTIPEFLNLLEATMLTESFVQCSLGKPLIVANLSGDNNVLKRVLLRPVSVKEGERILLVMTESRRDLSRTVTSKAAVEYVKEQLGQNFLSATLKTLERDVFLEITKSGGVQVGTSKPSTQTPPSRSHNREKQYLLSPKLQWLKDLGISNTAGIIRTEMRDKFIQIERFVNILRPELEKFSSSSTELKAIDVGSGKSYLTFALYQILTDLFPAAKVEVRGIEKRKDLSSLSNEVARSNGFAGLQFIHGLAETLNSKQTDIVVALHACDTATDDAIGLALKSDAKLICVAPCCHKYVRKKMALSGVLEILGKQGIHAERIGETITDSLRALFLESRGYRTKIVEFIDKSHTAKNTMILGTFSSEVDTALASEQLHELQSCAGLKDFYLDTLKLDSTAQQTL